MDGNRVERESKPPTLFLDNLGRVFVEASRLQLEADASKPPDAYCIIQNNGLIVRFLAVVVAGGTEQGEGQLACAVAPSSGFDSVSASSTCCARGN